MKTPPCTRTVQDLTSMTNTFYPFSAQSPFFQYAFNSLVHLLLHRSVSLPSTISNEKKLAGREKGTDIATTFLKATLY